MKRWGKTKRTIIALTWVFPPSAKEPADAAREGAAEEASQAAASRENIVRVVADEEKRFKGE